MKINMYNVDFGDCFLICDEQENLLVDFGSDNPDCEFDAVTKHILIESNSKSLSVLITHFHEDHISGFFKEPLKAKKIYLPDILAMGQPLGKLNFLQLNILADIFRCISLDKRMKITLYDLLLKLCDEKSTVVFLSRGEEFFVSEKEYQVLWPSFSDVTIHGRVLHRVIKALVTLGILPHSAIKEKLSTSYENAQTDSTSEKLEIEHPNESNLFLPESSLPQPVDLKTIDNFIAVLVKGYRLITSNERLELEQYKHMLQVSYNNLVEFIEKQLTDTYTHTSRNSLQRELADLSSSMKNQANKCSIVFQDKPINKTSNMLMTGDITSSELNKLLQGKIPSSGPSISKKYRVIKAPHHATDTHFTPLLPDCEIIMASNGVTSQNHSRWHKISYQYGAFYNSHKDSTMICSSNRCELVDLKNTKQCPNCKKGKIFVKEYNF